MPETTAPRKQTAAPAVEQPPATDPLVQEEKAPRPFDLGDVVEFIDSIKFQMGPKKTYQQGTVIGVIEGDGMTMVAVGMNDSMMYDAPRVEFLFDGKPTPMRKVED